MLWAYDDEKTRALYRKDGLGLVVQGMRKRRRTKRRWLDSVRDDIREKGLSGRCSSVCSSHTT